MLRQQQLVEVSARKDVTLQYLRECYARTSMNSQDLLCLSKVLRCPQQFSDFCSSMQPLQRPGIALIEQFRNLILQSLAKVQLHGACSSWVRACTNTVLITACLSALLQQLQQLHCNTAASLVAGHCHKSTSHIPLPVQAHMLQYVGKLNRTDLEELLRQRLEASSTPATYAADECLKFLVHMSKSFVAAEVPSPILSVGTGTKRKRTTLWLGDRQNISHGTTVLIELSHHSGAGVCIHLHGAYTYGTLEAHVLQAPAMNTAAVKSALGGAGFTLCDIHNLPVRQLVAGVENILMPRRKLHLRAVPVHDHNLIATAWGLPVSYHRNTVYNDGTILMRKLEASPHMLVPYILNQTSLQCQQNLSAVAVTIELHNTFWVCVRNHPDQLHEALHRFLTSRYLIDPLGPHRTGPHPTLTITFHDN